MCTPSWTASSLSLATTTCGTTVACSSYCISEQSDYCTLGDHLFTYNGTIEITGKYESILNASLIIVATSPTTTRSSQTSTSFGNNVSYVDLLDTSTRTSLPTWPTISLSTWATTLSSSTLNCFVDDNAGDVVTFSLILLYCALHCRLGNQLRYVLGRTRAHNDVIEMCSLLPSY